MFPPEPAADDSDIVVDHRTITPLTGVDSSEPQFYLSLVNKDCGVSPSKIHINRRKRTKITIGRGDSADVVIRLKKKGQTARGKICVSRLHCEIEKNPLGQWALFDKGSRNGCFVNGHKVRARVLEHGDIVVLGGGGIVKHGSHLQNVDSVFKFRFSKVESRKQSSKRKISEGPDCGNHQHEHGGCAKRMSPDKEIISHSTCHTQAEDLREEFSCGICLDVQIQPRVLCCGHSFCARCISTALTYQNSCPSCKTVVVSEPARVVSLESVIARLYADNVEYQTRQQEYEKLAQHELITKRKLLTLINKAKSSGKRFMSVKKKWDAQERQIFKKGVALYKGVARVEYCRAVGLTDEYVNNASAPELTIAAMNTGVKRTKTCSLKSRMLMFIKFG